MSVGWDAKLCPVSRTTPFSMKSRLVRAPGILKNFTNDK